MGNYLSHTINNIRTSFYENNYKTEFQNRNINLTIMMPHYNNVPKISFQMYVPNHLNSEYPEVKLLPLSLALCLDNKEGFDAKVCLSCIDVGVDIGTGVGVGVGIDDANNRLRSADGYRLGSMIRVSANQDWI